MEEYINEEVNKEKEEQNQNTYCIYMHINLHNRKKYIGQTKYGDDPNIRWRNGRGYKWDNTYFKRALQIHSDWDWDWSHHILENRLSREEADEREKYWIAYYDTTNPKKRYNLTKRGHLSYKRSEEQKKKVSEFMKTHPMSQEARKKAGRTLSKKMKGRKLGAETCQKISDSLSKPVQCVETLEIFKNSEEAAQKFNCGRSWIQKACKYGKVAKKHHFIYLTDAKQD